MAAMFAGAAAFAAQVSGTVKTADGSPLPKMLVTDGISWSETGADGAFKLDARDGQRFVILHEPTGYRAARRYIPTAEGKFDFVLTPAPVKPETRFVQIADTETEKFEFLGELKAKAAKYNADFIVHTGDICRWPAIALHAEKLNSQTMGRDVFYCVGNHDIVAPREDGSDYQDCLGPYWYSFERNGVMFIAGAMHYGDVALPYVLEDYGDWLAGLLKRTDKPYVLLGHNLPGQQMPPVIPSHHGNVKIDDRLLGIFFGHWHTNFELGCPQLKALAYCVANPNKAGIDHDPASYRMVTVTPEGIVDSHIEHAGYAGKIEFESAPAYGSNMVFRCDRRGWTRAFDADGNQVWSVPPVRSGIPPSLTGTAFADGVVYAGFGLDLKAIDAATGKVLWRNTEWSGSHSFMGRITVADGVVVSGSQWGGIYANDAATGKLLWHPNIEDLRFTTATVTHFDGAFWAKGLKKVYKLAPKTGEVLKIYDLGTEVQTAAPVISDGKNIFVASADRGVFALDKDTGGKVWQFNDQGAGLVTTTPYRMNMRGIEAPMSLSSGRLYVQAMDGYLYELNAADGKLLEKTWTGMPMADWRFGDAAGMR